MVESFPEDQLAHLREAYSRYDKDSDGIVNTIELDQIIKYLGYNVTEVQLRKWMIRVDCLVGVFDFRDFLQIISIIIKNLQIKKELIREFRNIDKDGSGRIGAAKLREILKEFGWKLNDEEVDELIRKADIDGDGCAIYEDFLVMAMEEYYN